ncbi:MAG: NAD(P)/FAD-dependent oxidoreductase, partial [Acidobacteriaceae bacterium]|nr:NAD(P)/FAD-dependent oxidoreductase [Acidobacteriaceae bacterium]
MDRRDFLNSTLLASGATLLGGASPLSLLAEPDWTGFTGIGDYSLSNGNTYGVMSAGHAIRDRTFERRLGAARDTKELFDCVVV